MIKICYISTGLSTGGTEVMLLKVLEKIDRLAFQPFVISLTDHGQIGEKIERLGIPVYSVHLNSFKKIPSALLKLARHLRSIKPDLVHTKLYHSDLLGGILVRMLGIKNIAWGIHQANLSRVANKRLTLFVIHCCAKLSTFIPKKIFSVSTRAANTHAAIGYDRAKFTVIPNGFDLDRFRPNADARRKIRTELGISEEAQVIGIFGRFDVQKNQIGFFRAAQRVRQELPDTHFILAGTDITMENRVLVEAIDSAGVTSKTHLLGRRNDMPSLMAAIDVMALSSIGEAFPNVVGEAMACEIPCVVTDVGDCDEIIGNTGRVVAVNDMNALGVELTAILKMSISDRLKLGVSARDRIAQHYEIGLIVRQYEQAYRLMVEETA